MIESDLVAMLKADTAVAAIVDARVYPNPAPEGVALPNVTWQQVSDTPTRVADGVLNLRTTRFQVNVWAASVLKVVSLSAAVRAAIDTWQSSAVQVAMTDNVVDLFDGSFSPPRWGRAIDITVVHKE